MDTTIDFTGIDAQEVRAVLFGYESIRYHLLYVTSEKIPNYDPRIIRVLNLLPEMLYHHVCYRLGVIQIQMVQRILLLGFIQYGSLHSEQFNDLKYDETEYDNAIEAFCSGDGIGEMSFPKYSELKQFIDDCVKVRAMYS